MTVFHIGWTILLVVTFVMITIWAYSARRKDDFDEAARLALDDEDLIDADGRSTEVQDG